MVETDQVEVERQLRAGELACPCGGGLAPWGHARERSIRGLGMLRPRRARCAACRVTHVLLAVVCLLRRADAVEVIGAALLSKAQGQGHRLIAARLERPASTVRGWLRAFALNAQAVRGICMALLVQLDPLAGPRPVHATAFADAVESVGACAAAARRRLGVPAGVVSGGEPVVGEVSPWQIAAAVTGGRLLAPAPLTESINTDTPLAAMR